MKFTLGWLRAHLDSTADAGTVASALTALGLEVETVRDPAAALAPFRIARVLAAAPHPQADKLQVLTVEAGAGPVQVVCGAPNARAGLVGVFGPPGAHVPGSGITLKVATIRGIESSGMMCSARELELGDAHEGIIELPADAPVGTAYAAWAGLDDPLFDIAVTPNRPDCLGVRGIARDLAAAGLGTLRPLAEVYGLSTEPVAGEGAGPEVRIEDVAGCPALYAQDVTGVRRGSTPPWMAARLQAVGQKPISALVDITNYVMIDLGRPLHVYDCARLRGALVVRQAREGETVRALNGRSYALAPPMTVIADDAGVHDIAGIMGGEASGVTEATTEVLIECAWFDPAAIARTGQALALTSDARARFERGVDPGFLDTGLALATRLVLSICGGRASAPTRAGNPPAARGAIAYDPALAEKLGGLPVPPNRQRAILAALGFGVDADWAVTPPSWRPDVDGPADLVEEVVRVEGIDRVPAVPLPRPPGVAAPTLTPAQRRERRVRRAAAGAGLDEAITWSFIAPDAATAFGPARALLNPISAELAVLRPSLLPGLLAAAARNLARGASGVRLFEIGRRYAADGETTGVGLVLAGACGLRDWRGSGDGAWTVWDAKAMATALLAAAGAPAERIQTMSDLGGEAGAAFHPGRSGTLRLGPKTVLARFGLLHPAVAAAFDLAGPVAVAEIELDAIPFARDGARARPAFAPPALQPVRRDFAFLYGRDRAADALLRAVRGADKAIVAVRLFDVFEGAGVPHEQRSLALEVTLQPGAQSFTEADLTALSARVVAAAAKVGAVLRT